MSTFSEKEVLCAVCGKKSMQLELDSYSIFGKPDLDFRPAEMFRGTMETWIQECPHCGYVEKDINKKSRIKKEILERLYEQAIITEEMSNLAYCFEKYALYLEYKKDYSGCIQNHLSAAWVCDDEGDEIAGVIFRSLCLEATNRLLQKFLSRKKRRKYLLIKADLLRRLKNKKELREMNADDNCLDFASREILLYQKELVEKDDFDAHSQDELDLDKYDDFFEKNISTREDIAPIIQECIHKALSLNENTRNEAIEKLKELRPEKPNIPYYEINEILCLHKDKPIREEYPLNVDSLAPVVNEEILELLESLVVPSDTYREKITEKNIFAMTLLFELYKSPLIADGFKDYAQKQQHRLYLMHIDREEGSDYYLTLIEPVNEEK